MNSRTIFRCFAIVALALSIVGLRAHADTVVYQNTTTAFAAYNFNGATTTGTDLAAYVDMNKLTLSAGSGGMAISSLSFEEHNFNSGSVSERGTMYVWAADGTGGLPGTLLDKLYLPLVTIGGNSSLTVTDPLAGGSLLIPANGVIWAGFGYDNDNGASAITAAQLNNLGGITYDPATVGTDGPQSYFVGASGAGSNPSVHPFGTPNGADYGWTVTATSVTPEPSSMMLLGTGLVGLAGMFRRGFGDKASD